MVPVLEVDRRPSPPPFMTRRRRRFLPPVKVAGVLLLVSWLGPVTFVQTDAPRILRWVGAPGSASAYPRVIPAGQAMVLAPGTLVELRLEGGRIVDGRFLGRALLEDSLYAERFVARSIASSFAPLVLGESLFVTLLDGREWRLPFAGYGELSLLLEHPDAPEPLRVPFEFTAGILRSNGERVEPKDLSRAFRAGKLPSAEALVIEDLLPVGWQADRWAAALRVPMEDVQAAIVKTESGGSVAGAVVLGALLGVVVFIALIAIAANSSRSSGGCSYDGDVPGTWTLTTAPFDLERRCYVGEALAVESRAASVMEVQHLALALPAAPDTLAR